MVRWPMSELREALKTDLKEMFGPRVSFSRTERKLYGHDIAAIPSLIKPLLGRTTPEAVVQPASEAELVALVKWASRHRIPLTPRGKASSGYGGAVPVRGGVVVDFYRLQAVKKIDAAAQTATVEPGIVFERLDRELARQGLMLKLYPSSYPWLPLEDGWRRAAQASGHSSRAGSGTTLSGCDW